jgi:hypothetical protein
MKGECRAHASMGMIEPDGWNLNEVKGQRTPLRGYRRKRGKAKNGCTKNMQSH